jgi:hypothetical protein
MFDPKDLVSYRDAIGRFRKVQPDSEETEGLAEQFDSRYSLPPRHTAGISFSTLKGSGEEAEPLLTDPLSRDHLNGNGRPRVLKPNAAAIREFFGGRIGRCGCPDSPTSSQT